MSIASSCVDSSPRVVKLMISPGRFIVYTRIDECEHIHIREYVCSMLDEERLVPSSTGAYFTAGQIRSFLNTLPKISKNNSSDRKRFLGSGMMVTPERRYDGRCLKPKVERPYEMGVYLFISHWHMLKPILETLLVQHPDFTYSNLRNSTVLEILTCNTCAQFDLHMTNSETF